MNENSSREGHSSCRLTFEFRGLTLEPGQPVLVRLVRLGEILDLATIKVP